MPDNETQIRELIENWAEAVRKKDIDGILAYHSEDFVMYDVPEPFQSVGLEAYRKTWDTFYKYTKLGVFDIHELNIVAGEDVAFAHAKMQCEDKSTSDDYIPLDFRLTVGLKKINNQWMILHEHHSIPATT
jgi:ketosteroid isomerase-like protein